MSLIQALNFPKAPLKLSKKNNQVFVWCIVRRQNLVLTPEEWVRQHCIHFLINELGVPLGRIASEYSILVNGLSRRCDLVVFNPNGLPQVIVECKAPEVQLTENVLFQIAQYNKPLQVDYLMFTNGLQHIYATVDYKTGDLNYLRDFSKINW